MSTIDHIAGETYHGRRGETTNAFRYSIDFVLCDAEAPLKTPRLFARNGGGVMSLHDRDHGGQPKAGQGAAWVRDILATHDLDVTGRIDLLAQPRVLGHVFNPDWLALVVYGTGLCVFAGAGECGADYGVGAAGIGAGSAGTGGINL